MSFPSISYSLIDISMCLCPGIYKPFNSNEKSSLSSNDASVPFKVLHLGTSHSYPVIYSTC